MDFRSSKHHSAWQKHYLTISRGLNFKITWVPSDLVKPDAVPFEVKSVKHLVSSWLIYSFKEDYLDAFSSHRLLMFLFFLILRPFGTTRRISQNLFREGDGAVYLFLDGCFRHVPDPPTFRALFRVPLEVAAMNACGRIKKELKGPALPSGARLVKGNGSEIFLVEGTTKRHVVSLEVWNSFDFDWGKVTQCNVDTFEIGKAILHENPPTEYEEGGL